jgi:hypothetical protein
MLLVVSVLYRMQFSAHRALHDMRETRVLRNVDGIQLTRDPESPRGSYPKKQS